LGSPQLMESQSGPTVMNGTAGIIDPLAQEVLPEPTLLPLSMSKATSGALARPGDGPSPPAVVEQDVHRFLEHRFSLRMMISGAFSSWSRFRRLLRLMTRR